VRTRQVLLFSACALAATSAVGWFSWDRAHAAELADVAAEAGEPLLSGDTVYPGAAYSRYSSATSVVLLVGDSHSAHLLSGLVPLARKHGYGVSHVGFGGCLGVTMAERLWGTNDLFARCQSSAQAILQRFLREPAVKIILFSARGELYAEGKEAGIVVAADNNTALPADVRLRVLHDAYADAIGRAEEAGKRAVLALDIPELDFVPEYCLSRLSSAALFGKQCAIDRRSVDERQRNYRSVVRRLQDEYPRLAVFDPIPLLCDSAWCYTKRNGLVMYSGDNHLGADGSRLVAQQLGAVLFESGQEAPRVPSGIRIQD
jgi:hypothetical protein